MGEVRFYRLAGEGVGDILPVLIERVLSRGQRALVRATEDDILAHLDERLWTYRQDSFLPHGLSGAHDADQPVLLTSGTDVPNGADILLLADRTPLDLGEAERFAMIVRLFEAADAGAVEQARDEWRAVAGAGLDAVFWAKEDGKWAEKARSGGS